jgi:hypothetical protein
MSGLPPEVKTKIRHAIHLSRDYGFKLGLAYTVDRNDRCTCSREGCSSAGKHPIGRDWPNLTTRDPHEIKRRFLETDWPDPDPDHGFNFLIQPCERFVVVDLDFRIKNGEIVGNGVARAMNLARKGSAQILKGTYCQETPSGGYHLVYARKTAVYSQPDMKSGIDNGIDLPCQVIGAYSRNPKGLYKVYRDIVPTPEPEWVTRLLLKLQADREAVWTAAEEERENEEPASPNDIASMLDRVDPDCSYDKWRNIVWAVAAAPGLDLDDLKELARTWSERGAKWNESAFELVWRSNKHQETGRRIGYGTLVYYALGHRGALIARLNDTEADQEAQRAAVYSSLAMEIDQ